jgi:hypothetical protein
VKINWRIACGLDNRGTAPLSLHVVCDVGRMSGIPGV